MTTPEFTPTPLFGGAITVDLPSTFGDVSAIRQVPDHQEAYLDSNGFTSVVFDILERVEEPQAKNDEEALKYHFEDITAGAADRTEVYRPGEARLTKMPTTPAYTLLASQRPLQKRKPTDADFTVILMIMVRLAEQKTDIVVSVNVPHVPGEYRSEEIDLSRQMLGGLLERGFMVRDRILQSFEIKDWGLFGE